MISLDVEPAPSLSDLYQAWARTDAAYSDALAKVVGEMQVSRPKHWQEPPSEACRPAFDAFLAARAAYKAAVEDEGDTRMIAAVRGMDRP